MPSASPVVPPAPTLLKGQKLLTLAEISAYISKCSLNITLVKVETDVESSVNDLVGPWVYKNKKKTWVHYCIDNDIENTNKIRLDNILKRGFPEQYRKTSTNYKYEWYSWNRFKFEAQKDNSIEEVLSDEKKFLQVLDKVNVYYRQHLQVAEVGGLHKYKGPQTFADSKNTTILHYYGKGQYKWYIKSYFEKEMDKLYTTDVHERKLELFGHKPFTSKVSDKDFEVLLRKTHERIDKDLGRNKIAKKLEAYSGPQCHEDRGLPLRMSYNPRLFQYPWEKA